MLGDKYLFEYLLSFLGYIARSGIAGSYVDSMFNILRRPQTFF